MYVYLDRAEYPGDDVARYLKDHSNVAGFGYYLGGRNAAAGTETWNGKRTFLASLGCGFIPIYVGEQDEAACPSCSHELTIAQGARDADRAAQLMALEGFPKSSTVYLDVEGGSGSPLSESCVRYVAAWVNGIAATDYEPGLYVGHTGADQVMAATKTPFTLWVVGRGDNLHSCDPNLTSTYYYDTPEEEYQEFKTVDPKQHHPKATIVQWCLSLGERPCYIQGGSEWVPSWDFNTSLVKDPSMLDGIEDGNGGGSNMPTGLDVVKAAYELLGAPYRVWAPGMSTPTYLDDRVRDPPPAGHLKIMGVECADLVCYALARCGITVHAGTGLLGDYLVDVQPFDIDAPGEPGAVAFKPYEGPALNEQGHVGIYVDDHRLLQSLYSYGVVDDYTDTQTYGWGGSTEFMLYGKLPGISYDGSTPAPAGDEGLWRRYGWYEAINERWDLIWHPPEGSK